MKFKKTAMIAALVLSSNVMAADPTASVLWTGLVPGSVEGDAIKITGLAGGAINNGTLIVARDGTFTSNEVNLESHLVETNELQEATWTLSSSIVNYGSSVATDANLIVKNNGAEWVKGTEINNTDRVTLSVAQDAAVETAVGEAVQVQVTVVASANI
ncbi:hypothetical protein [Vibrio metschnikovii]|uniref:hypothetical protein n=1 Tax=Vibrio metschnikovii TaxID=28172 RepID=UPI001C2F7CFB|nr:hypothetical protein [Vibrio metschnikovii]